MRSRWGRAISARSESFRRSWLLAAAFGALACSDPLGPEEGALAEARARWRAADVQSYTFELQRSCFCGPDVLRPVRIAVTAGEVSAATYVDTGEPVPTPLDEVPTVPDLFDEVQDAIDRDAFSIEAAYDADLGYPLSVTIDFLEMAVDEEQHFQINALDVAAAVGSVVASVGLA